MPEVKTSTIVRCLASALRDYLGTTEHLPSISDPELELEVLNAPDTVTEGESIEFRISAYGFKQKMEHRYVKVSETEIVAEQTDGPTRSWLHRQTIVANEDGSSTLTDHIEFEPPGGMLGFVMTAEKIEESIREGMEFRYQALEEILGC